MLHTGIPGRGSELTAIQKGGELVTTHRDTFRGEAMSSSINSSEFIFRRQRQKITCIPQGNGYAYFFFQLLNASKLDSGTH